MHYISSCKLNLNEFTETLGMLQGAITQNDNQTLPFGYITGPGRKPDTMLLLHNKDGKKIVKTTTTVQNASFQQLGPDFQKSMFDTGQSLLEPTSTTPAPNCNRGVQAGVLQSLKKRGCLTTTPSLKYFSYTSIFNHC